MRYAGIDEYETVNGRKNGMSLYVQGCLFHCQGCHNPETWDFNGGKEWTHEIEDKFIELASRPYIKRISLLGGECLADKNLDGVLNLVNRVCFWMPEKTIWLYTGYTWEQLFAFPTVVEQRSVLPMNNGRLDFSNWSDEMKRRQIVKQCNVLVDGLYEHKKRDITLPFRGSTNQRVINIPETLKQGKVVLYCE